MDLWEQPHAGEPRQITTFTPGRVLWLSIAYDGKIDACLVRRCCPLSGRNSSQALVA